MAENSDEPRVELLEGVFEQFLWRFRFLVVIAVVASLVASLALFLMSWHHGSTHK